MYELLSITKSSRANKKMMAIFRNKTTGRSKTVHFGNAGSSDYTISKNDDMKQLYLNRHRAREDWTDLMSAGALSRFILWEKKDMGEAIKLYFNKFNKL
jgi:hypothetical protein